jgi:hypothetical protein
MKSALSATLDPHPSPLPLQILDNQVLHVSSPVKLFSLSAVSAEKEKINPFAAFVPLR